MVLAELDWNALQQWRQQLPALQHHVGERQRALGGAAAGTKAGAAGRCGPCWYTDGGMLVTQVWLAGRYEMSEVQQRLDREDRRCGQRNPCRFIAMSCACAPCRVMTMTP